MNVFGHELMFNLNEKDIWLALNGFVVDLESLILFDHHRLCFV